MKRFIQEISKGDEYSAAKCIDLAAVSRAKTLDELAENTGGRLYYVENLDDLATISERIGNELRNQYLLGYSPTNASRDGKFRRVKVNLAAPPEMPNLRTYYRHGYYAPAE